MYKKPWRNNYTKKCKYDKCDSLTSRHKITKDGLTCHYNQSTGSFHDLHSSKLVCTVWLRVSCNLVGFGLFNGISTLYGLFNAEIGFTSECSIIIITIYKISLIYLFNGISTPNGSFNAKFGFTSECFIIIITINKISLVYLFNGISTPNESFKAEIWFISKCLIVILTIFSMLFFFKLHFVYRYLFANICMVLIIPISSSSSSSSCAASMDFLDSLSLFILLIYCFRQVLQTTSCVSTELL